MGLKDRSPTRTTARSGSQKTETIPTAEPVTATATKTRAKSSSNSSPLTTRAVAPLLSLEGIQHGLDFPVFETNSYFAKDLFTVSSALPETSKAEADAAEQTIERQLQSLRVAQANIKLNRGVVKTGTLQQKLWGDVIDYATVGMENRTKAIGYQIAGVNQATALTKLDQANERFNQEETILHGMRGMTPLIEEEWKQRQNLKLSRIEDLKVAVYQASSRVASEIEAMGSDFQNELQAL